MKTVYYETIPGDDAPGVDAVCVTSKSYWDGNHAVDDGSGQDYMPIAAAMASYGAAELCESVFAAPEAGVPALVSAMAARGFRLVKDPSFTAFLRGTEEGGAPWD